MKVIAGTNRKKNDSKTSFTKETSGQPKKKPNTLKIPEGAKDVSHTVRQIHNGFIKSTSYRNPKTESHEHHEIYYESDPFGHVEGLD